MACREKKGTNYHGYARGNLRSMTVMLSQSFKFFIEYVSDSIEFFFYTPSIFWRSFFFLFPFARFILSIFEEEEKNFRNKRLVDNLEGGKWSRFFMELDSFEFFFSLFHPFFSFCKIYFINLRKRREEFSK